MMYEEFSCGGEVFEDMYGQKETAVRRGIGGTDGLVQDGGGISSEVFKTLTHLLVFLGHIWPMGLGM